MDAHADSFRSVHDWREPAVWSCTLSKLRATTVRKQMCFQPIWVYTNVVSDFGPMTG
ncbi:hypothetical protein C8K18_10496 [Paraburkholderia sp. GV068]|jgi:hypothetical protein|uniref:Uncharacterized protein n=1 Tax=Paraburkholderia graminis (strain ATCC 700544 / DSM 17151 / LMG 18924 / NCIMB 13744 / C4D1M) TaxID=396598 RepID=B1FST8_PARG4|nr:hypothetical protein BgramDRAFT_0210 [Paraburkholderia graminis C4D1M]MDR6470109.1 hypothetical protein [Paraburkholderia graminis]PTR01793.1 hypothetical protein C8K19_10496 [Paraburkholderia sp. GV072]PUB06005.1 hypothetical protein C8K18_10496 [Paraburkholderia sp. GV068]MDR6475879.1 hypothetical protein [Paraburkholderia graminis]